MSKKIGKFEKAKIIGQRAEQISMGAPSTVDITGITTALEIAEKEFREKKIPFIIKRIFPNGKVVEIPFSEMIEL